MYLSEGKINSIICIVVEKRKKPIPIIIYNIIVIIVIIFFFKHNNINSTQIIDMDVINIIFNFNDDLLFIK